MNNFELLYKFGTPEIIGEKKDRIRYKVNHTNEYELGYMKGLIDASNYDVSYGNNNINVYFDLE